MLQKQALNGILVDMTEQSIRDQVVSQIPVDSFTERFTVTHSEVVDTLHQFPSLCYLLGRITDLPQTRDIKFDNVERHVYYLVEGSGMFGLAHPDDAMRWKGIFNHSIGTPRHVFYLAQGLRDLSPDERTRFEDRGYSFSEFDSLEPELIRDVMMPSHNSRRGFDERNWYDLNDEVHKPGTPGELAHAYLDQCGAPAIFADLISRVEEHADHLPRAGVNYFPNILDAILTYGDWVYLQRPATLKESFDAKRKNRSDIDEDILTLLESCGRTFETDINEILKIDILEELKLAGPYEWETQIRRAYCAPSGIRLEDAFQTYVAQYPQVVQ